MRESNQEQRKISIICVYESRLRSNKKIAKSNTRVTRGVSVRDIVSCIVEISLFHYHI